MPNLSGALANFGLISRGMNSAREDANTLASQGRTAELETMGLEDVRRNRAENTRLGDMQRQLKGRELEAALQQSGLVSVANEYMMTHSDKADAPATAAVPRPDLAALIPGLGPDSITADNKGNITFKDPKTGQSATRNVTAILTAAGKMPKATTSPIGAAGSQTLDPAGNVIRLQPPLESTTPKVVSAPAGSEVFVTGGKRNPLDPANRTRVPEKSVERAGPTPNQLVHEMKNEDGSTTLIDINPSSPNYGNPVASGTGAGGSNNLKQLPVLKEVSNLLMDIEGMSKPDPTDPNPLTTKRILTDLGLKTGVEASRILQANPRGMTHLEAIDMAQNAARTGKTLVQSSSGGLGWKDKSGNITPIRGVSVGVSRMVTDGKPIPDDEQAAASAAFDATQRGERVSDGSTAPAPAVPAAAPAPSAQPVAQPQAPVASAQAIVRQSGVRGLIAVLSKLYPPSQERSGRGMAISMKDSTEVAKFRSMTGPAALQYADQLIRAKQGQQVAGFKRGGKVQRYGLGM